VQNNEPFDHSQDQQVQNTTVFLCCCFTPVLRPNPGLLFLGAQWHKDGTGNCIREHCARTVSTWYYPCETTLEMGPTAIIPASPYCADPPETVKRVMCPRRCS
jgi:hypothetical protein